MFGKSIEGSPHQLVQQSQQPQLTAREARNIASILAEEEWEII